MIRSLVLLVSTAALPAAARAQSAAESAERFSLDLPPAEDAAQAPAEASTEPAPAKSRFSADTPIEQLIANRRSKAVLDREMPGLSADKNLPKFSKLSLRQLAPLSGGRVTPELIARVDTDLSAID